MSSSGDFMGSFAGSDASWWEWHDCWDAGALHPLNSQSLEGDADQPSMPSPALLPGCPCVTAPMLSP